MRKAQRVQIGAESPGALFTSLVTAKSGADQGGAGYAALLAIQPLALELLQVCGLHLQE